MIDYLQQLLLIYHASNELVTIEALAPFEKFLSDRWNRIEKSDAAYKDAKDVSDSQVNKLCRSMAKYMCTMTSANGKTYQYNSDKLLKPVMRPEIDRDAQNARLWGDFFDHLKNEDSQLMSALQAMKMTMGDLIKQILKECKNLPEKTWPNLFVNLESHHTVKKITALLLSYENSTEEITRHSLQPFIKFLKDRWEWIDHPDASYLKNPHTQANIICIILSEFLSIAGYKINYLNRNKNRLLMPVPHHDLTPEKAADKLKQAIYNNLATRNDLINELMSLDKCQWREYLSGMSKQKLINLITNGKNTIDDIFSLQDLFTVNESYNRTLSYCLFEVYLKDLAYTKAEEADFANAISSSIYKVSAGSDLTYFTPAAPVIDDSQRYCAAEAIHDFILSEETFDKIETLLSLPGNKLSKHKACLNEGLLHDFFSLLINAAEASKPKKHEVPLFLIN
ncbi:MAG: hypothetical protein JO149_08225, partial [Gammaproteobacteria bacterium]|nr:hypothetical protein [Gammaproteobacteria bacterium]